MGAGKHGRKSRISGGDLTPSAAVVKLMHALAWHRSADTLKTYIENPVAGERS